jgi:glutaredoxin
MNPVALIIKGIRNGLGLIIVFVDWVSRPKAAQRSAEEQVKAQTAVSGISLYQFFACPFCVKTRRAIHALNVNIESRDINKNLHFRTELQENAGKVKVPCLRIEENDEVRWMYESNDIIEFIQNRVSNAGITPKAISS